MNIYKQNENLFDSLYYKMLIEIFKMERFGSKI